MKTVEWAWNSDPDTPDEKLVLIAMARDTYRTPLEALAIVGSRVLRHAVCDMTPAELDAASRAWNVRDTSRRTRIRTVRSDAGSAS